MAEGIHAFPCNLPADPVIHFNDVLAKLLRIIIRRRVPGQVVELAVEEAADFCALTVDLQC